MNLINVKLKKSEQYGWYKKSRRRFQLKLRARNLSKEQVDMLEKAVRKAIDDVLPIEEKKVVVDA